MSFCRRQKLSGQRKATEEELRKVGSELRSKAGCYCEHYIKAAARFNVQMVCKFLAFCTWGSGLFPLGFWLFSTVETFLTSIIPVLGLI